jgi:FkbM family methyltransferase
MNSLRRKWVSLVSYLICSLEEIFFYPKLADIYKKLNLTNDRTGEDAGGLTIFDVGANTGQSINFFKRIYPNSRIFAFEPSAKTFAQLQLQVYKNTYKNVSISQLGMGEVSDTIEFYESILNETSTFVLPNQKSQYLRNKNRILFQKNENAFESANAQITTFDRFIAENDIERVDILKIDVEGFEFQVLRGARKSLAQGKIGIIQLEKHTDDMREDNHPAIHMLLLEYGYIQISEIKHPFGSFQELQYRSRCRGLEEFLN